MVIHTLTFVTSTVLFAIETTGVARTLISLKVKYMYIIR